MILRGIDFGFVWQASGATNFYGQGWWYHHLLRPFGLDFSGATFVAKTSTMFPREGNMPLKNDRVTPKEWLPQSIHVNRKTGAALNAVSLSGPGLDFLLRSGEWQKRKDAYFISIMSVAGTADERQGEIERCANLIREHKKGLGRFGIQLNVSCPNGGLDTKSLVTETMPYLDTLRGLDVPVVVKLGPETQIKAAAEIANHPACDALHVFNTLPWDKLPDEEKIKYFGTTTSPLVAKLGEKFKGGVSGKPLKGRLVNWLRDARNYGIRKPINAGGGILCSNDAGDMIDAGADGISLGSIAFLASTQVKRTTRDGKLFAIQARCERERPKVSVNFATT